MKTKIIELARICKEAIEDEARASYKNGDNEHCFDGCACIITLKNGDQIEVEVDADMFSISHKVTIWGHNCENIERAIEEWLDANADEFGAWQDEHDSDPWRDVDEGCDPAFPHHGDFERWAYGY